MKSRCKITYPFILRWRWNQQSFKPLHGQRYLSLPDSKGISNTSQTSNFIHSGVMMVDPDTLERESSVELMSNLRNLFYMYQIQAFSFWLVTNPSNISVDTPLCWLVVRRQISNLPQWFSGGCLCWSGERTVS